MREGGEEGGREGTEKILYIAHVLDGASCVRKGEGEREKERGKEREEWDQCRTHGKEDSRRGKSRKEESTSQKNTCRYMYI